jgi:hypothetical protein
VRRWASRLKREFHCRCYFSAVWLLGRHLVLSKVGGGSRVERKILLSVMWFLLSYEFDRLCVGFGALDR